MKALGVVLFAVAYVLATVYAYADPTEPCARAEYLAGEVADGLALIEELTIMAQPVCAEKALARECARQRIEIRARVAEVKQLEALRKKAAAECKAGTATRKASAAP